MPKMKHPEGGTAEVGPAYVEYYESQGWEKVTPAKKATAKKAEPTRVVGEQGPELTHEK